MEGARLVVAPMMMPMAMMMTMAPMIVAMLPLSRHTLRTML